MNLTNLLPLTHTVTPLARYERGTVKTRRRPSRLYREGCEAYGLPTTSKNCTKHSSTAFIIMDQPHPLRVPAPLLLLLLRMRPSCRGGVTTYGKRDGHARHTTEASGGSDKRVGTAVREGSRSVVQLVQQVPA